jgi:ophiobolin F synthase
MGWARFGANISLTKSEEEAVSSVLQPLCDSVILMNDYFSWEKEFSAGDAKASAVSLYMRWFSMSATDAKAAIKIKTIELEEKYLELKTEYLQRNREPGLSTNILHWLDIMEAIAAGTMLWSTTCPRYKSRVDTSHKEYYNMRRAQGFDFFDSCTQSKDLLSSEKRALREDCSNITGSGLLNGVHLNATLNGISKHHNCIGRLSIF